ncbi:MAG: hypothetical protein IKR59_03315 [Lachnospiraceae bacterium]|nr:hypothetical protein [Lachnospiraceae bacterium]
MTTEAALALPLFLVFLAAVLSLFPTMRTERRLLGEVRETARTAAELRTGEEIKGTGIFSDTTEAFYETAQEYHAAASFPLKIAFFSAASDDTVIGVQAVARAWTGKSIGGGFTEKLVYVTTYGTVYHTSLSCPYLKLSVQYVPRAEVDSLRNADGKKYYPCEYCGTQACGSTVCITTYGTRWHTQSNCAGLKRGIRSLLLSEAGGLPCCSRCAAGEGGK